MKKTNPYKVGDVLYQIDAGGEREEYLVNAIRGEMIDTEKSGYFHWRWFKGRLKPKTKPREWWIKNREGCFSYSGYGIIMTDLPTLDKDNWIHVKEVLK
jgi:hypothetical protein